MCTCVSSLVGEASLVLHILLLFKNDQNFHGLYIVHGSNKIESIGIGSKDFGGCDLSGFGDTATVKNDQISLFDHGL